MSFKYRNYDPSLARFHNIDPLAEEYSYQSTYNFSENRVIDAIELEGLEAFSVHGTWSSQKTWQNQKGISTATKRAFGNNENNFNFQWSGDNLSSARTSAASNLVAYIIENRSSDSNEPISIVGHSHGGNVGIEAANIMAGMDELSGVEINLMTINTPVRDDYQLSDEASIKGSHINVYDSSDPVQIRGGNDPKQFTGTKTLHRGKKRITVTVGKKNGLTMTGEKGKAGRTYNNATNIKTSKSHGLFEDFHNSHNRTGEWINQIEY